MPTFNDVIKKRKTKVKVDGKNLKTDEKNEERGLFSKRRLISINIKKKY